MELGCLFPPTVGTPAHIEQAETLGYRRAYVYDSPAFLAGPRGSRWRWPPSARPGSRSACARSPRGCATWWPPPGRWPRWPRWRRAGPRWCWGPASPASSCWPGGRPGGPRWPGTRPLVTPELIAQTTGTGTAAEIRARLAGLAGSGTAGVLYGPMGPDIPRELAAFAAAAAGS